MQKRFIFYVLLALMLSVSPVEAALKSGDKAPDFSAEASLGGTVFTFVLGDALKQGPVVLYFYPAAFTHGCTIEAHDFAEAVDDFKTEGATIIGVSHDTIATLNKFSVSECRSKFAVVSDQDGAIMKAYDAVMITSALGLADRTSYVITPDHKILYAYSSLNPDQHVTNTLQALQAWRKHSTQFP
jgi:thioredoxin-dependent peroxiredoxin